MANPGDTFVAFGETFEVTEVARLMLVEVADEHCLEEGVDSPEAFIQVWNALHPIRGFQGEDGVWFHKFRKVTL